MLATGARQRRDAGVSPNAYWCLGKTESRSASAKRGRFQELADQAYCRTEAMGLAQEPHHDLALTAGAVEGGWESASHATTIFGYSCGLCGACAT